MGFIDWLKKDKDVKEMEDDVLVEDEAVNEEDNGLDDDDLSSLKELSNSEREQSLGFDEQEDDEEENNSFDMQSSNNSFNSYTNNYSMPQQNASFTIFKVADEEDVRQVLKHLSTNAPCIASFDRIRRKDYQLIMKYLQGGLFVMGANMSEWQNNSYILVPKGMAINMQEKTRRKR